MGFKQNDEGSVEKKRIPVIIIGILFMIALLLVVYEYRSYEPTAIGFYALDIDSIEEKPIPISKQHKTPSPARTAVIKIVDNQKIIQDKVEADSTRIQESQIEDIVPVPDKLHDEKIFTQVEEMPSFPGGEALLKKFIDGHMIYPTVAKDAGIQGTVYVTFIVDKSGRLNDVEVLRSIGGGCDEEAVRIVKNMPPWQPGKQFGKPAKVKYNLPVRFTLR